MDKCALLWNILVVLLPKGLGSEAGDLLESTAQMALIGKAGLFGNLGKRCFCEQQMSGLLNPLGKDVLMRRSNARFKASASAIWANKAGSRYTEM